ncbi:hypothetical protein PHLGIDRAFT_384344 [Phlebiopsis gigantea 11061_1 CR5-6]|uniref:Uncharacterized protein n=1 Tax=Phlebiopsis gigantea (strain 11061_1 CR5-6) TaxID=745531 RepID=A0A0C3N9J2_PHLG1|nr:hypothetical protein PHLGIDRAFT_384344 [Phlebiopsis gigantea 11061_1 CR5-6]
MPEDTSRGSCARCAGDEARLDEERHARFEDRCALSRRERRTAAESGTRDVRVPAPAMRPTRQNKADRIRGWRGLLSPGPRACTSVIHRGRSASSRGGVGSSRSNMTRQTPTWMEVSSGGRSVDVEGCCCSLLASPMLHEGDNRAVCVRACLSARHGLAQVALRGLSSVRERARERRQRSAPRSRPSCATAHQQFPSSPSARASTRTRRRDTRSGPFRRHRAAALGLRCRVARLELRLLALTCIV